MGVAELDETLLWSSSAWTLPSPPHWVARYAAKESYGVADYFIFQLPEDAENDLLYQQLTAVQQERRAILKIWTYSAPSASPSP